MSRSGNDGARITVGGQNVLAHVTSEQHAALEVRRHEPRGLPAAREHHDRPLYRTLGTVLVQQQRARIADVLVVLADVAPPSVDDDALSEAKLEVLQYDAPPDLSSGSSERGSQVTILKHLPSPRLDHGEP